MDRNTTEILAELGRRMSGHGSVAARNIARDMLSRQVLAEWLERYPVLPVGMPRNVLVIMAGNIPFVGMHDLVCVLAAGHRAIVKPSSRDIENISWVVAQLLDIEPGLPVSIVYPDRQPSTVNRQLNAVIAMGADDTVAAIARRYAGIPMLLRGSRWSLAVLSGDEKAGELEGLADDVLMNSGVGCRNVSLVWIRRDYDLSRLRDVFARRVDGLAPKYRNNYRQARAMLRLGGVPHTDCGACLLVEGRDFSAQPSILNYSFYDDPQEVADWIAQHDQEIQCVAANHCQFGRSAGLGQTQRPRLSDYPDGRDTMQFLSEI